MANIKFIEYIKCIAIILTINCYPCYKINFPWKKTNFSINKWNVARAIFKLYKYLLCHKRFLHTYQITLIH